IRFLSFFFQAEDGIRDLYVTGVQTCALPISSETWSARKTLRRRASHDMEGPPEGLTSGVGEHAPHAATQPYPALFLDLQLPSARAGDGIEARLAVLVGQAPFGTQPALLRHAVKGRIKGAF